MGLVDHEQGAVPRGQLAQPAHEAVLGQDDADVRQRRLGEHRGDVAVAQLLLDARQVVPRRRARREVERHRRSDVAGPAHGRAVRTGQGEGLVDAAVVAVPEDEDLAAAGDEAGKAHRPPVGVGGGEGEAPARHREAPGQLGGDPLRVGSRQHRRQPAEVLGAAPDRRERRVGGVPGHRARVAEREVDALVTVEIGDAVPLRRLETEREPAGPHPHPRHRDLPEEVRPLLVQRAAARVGGGVGGGLGLQQRAQPGAVEGCHEHTVGAAKGARGPLRQVGRATLVRWRATSSSPSPPACGASRCSATSSTASCCATTTAR